MIDGRTQRLRGLGKAGSAGGGAAQLGAQNPRPVPPAPFARPHAFLDTSLMALLRQVAGELDEAAEDFLSLSLSDPDDLDPEDLR